MDQPEAYLGRLKPIYLFRGLSEAELLEVAEQLDVETVAAGEEVFEQGEEGQDFYIINRGRVKVLKVRPNREPVLLATLVPGDFFGEGALLYGRRRSATIQAETDLELLRLSKEDFDDLLKRFPRIRPNLLLSHASHELYRHHRWNWLSENEVVYLITRKHKAVLYQMLIPPILLAGVVGLAAVWLAVGTGRLWMAWAGAALEVPVALWLLWNWIDWGNDYYIVTNQRVVYLEKILGIYDSRLEAPLGSIVSVNLQTDSTVQRMLGMGDVVVRTYSGPITLRSVENPGALSALIEEHWIRTRTREREAQAEQMRRTIRERIVGGQGPAPGKPPTPASKPPTTPPAKPAAGRPKPATSQLGRWLSFRVRFEQGGNVVYRKHWALLLRDVWKPSLGILGLLALVTAAAAGLLPQGLRPSTVLVVALLGAVPLLGWWLYEYVDWRNDIYMVTADQILDIIKKPLGAETKKAAPLGNILSLKYERPGLLGVMLNYGSVIALIAGAEFRFDGVYDPVGVQNDVYRRMEANKVRQSQAEATKRRDEMAEWLSVYHRMQEELEPNEPPPTKPVNPVRGPGA